MPRVAVALFLVLALGGAGVVALRYANRSAFVAKEAQFRERARRIAPEACPGTTVTLGTEPGSLLVQFGSVRSTWNVDNLVKEALDDDLSDEEIERRMRVTAKRPCSDPRLPGDVAKTWETARPLLRPLLVPASYAERNHLVSRPFAVDIAATCAIDFPEHVAYVVPSMLTAWKVDEPTIFSAAIDNLAAAVASTTVIDASAPADPLKAGKFLAVADDDGYAAARILVPAIRQRITAALGDPFYAAVPNRAFLVAWSKDYAFADEFAAKARRDFDARPYPISPNVFLVHADGGTSE